MVGLLVSGVGIPFGVRFAWFCYFLLFWIWIWICLCLCVRSLYLSVSCEWCLSGWVSVFFFPLVFSGLVARVCLSFNLVLGLGKKDLLQLTLSILWGKSTRSMYLGLVIYLSIYIRSCKSMTFIIHLIKINIKITHNSSKQD